MFGFEFIHSLVDGILVEVDQAHVLLEIFQLSIYSLLFDFEAIVVSELHLSSFGLNLVQKRLEFGIDHLEVLDPSHFHCLEQFISILNQFLRLRTALVHLPHYALTVLFQDVHALLFSDEAVSTVVHDAVDTDEFHAGVTEMLHQLLRVNWTKV